MSSLKSLKFGGVRNALRKLLRKRSSPAVDSSGASTPAGGQLAADDHIHLPQQNGKSHDSSTLPYSSPDKTASSPALATTSTSRSHADDTCNGVSAHETTASSSSTAAAASPTHGQGHNDDDDMPGTAPLADQKQSHQKVPPPQPRVPADSENKENVPPGGAGELDAAFAALKLDGGAVVPDLSFLNDPVVAAERAEHLRFIGEALDMVSVCRLECFISRILKLTKLFITGPPGPKNQRNSCRMRLGAQRQSDCQGHECHQRNKERDKARGIHGSVGPILIRSPNWPPDHTPQAKGGDRQGCKRRESRQGGNGQGSTRR